MEGACSSQSSKIKGHEHVERREPLCAQYHEQGPHQGILLCYLKTPRIKMWWESWTIKKAECWRIDDFELWCWRRLLRVPWTARRSNQSILKEISPEYSLEGLMLNLKLQYFGHLMQKKTWLIGKDPDAGKDWRQEEKGMTEDDSWMASLTWWTWIWASSGSWWWTGKPGMLQPMGSQRVGHYWATELNWTELNWRITRKS